MKKKLILVVFIIFLVTGCADVDYNLEIDKDLTVIENVNMSATREYFNNYYMNLPITVVKGFYNNEEWMKPLKDNNYFYELRENNTPYPSVFASKKYNSLDEYINNTAYKNQSFDDMSVTMKDNLVTISAKEFNQYLPDDSDGSMDGKNLPSKLKVNIKLPFVVTKSNADSINKKTNTYTWTINENTEEKEINITFDKTRTYIYNLSWYISLSIIIIIIIVAIILIIRAIRKNKLNNGV